MKIHIYKWPMDKIPLNSVPFYKDDSANLIQNTLNQVKERTVLATEYYDFSTFSAVDFGEHKEDMYEYYKKYSGKERADMIMYWLENWTVYSVHAHNNDTKRHLLMLTKTDEDNNLKVYAMLVERTPINVSFRGFLKLCNEKFKDLWYNSVAYYFPVQHRLKPDLSRDDYDKVLRVWASDDFMWYRCYVKNLDK